MFKECYTQKPLYYFLFFPMEGQESSQKSPLSGLSQTQVFVFGIVEGILVLCTIGFFILLPMVLGGSSTTPSVGSNNNYVAPSDDLGAPTPSTDISVMPVDEKRDHIRGAKNAKVTIVEYSDLECPFCKRFHETMQQVVQKYGNDVRWVYRHFPLDSLHAQARTEALATECAGEQGKFWEFTDLIIAETPSNDGLDLGKLPDYAKQVGLNVSKFQSCLDSKKFASKIQEDEQDAQRAGGQGTPYSVAIGPNGELIPINGAQPLAAVEATIQQFLQ